MSHDDIEPDSLPEAEKPDPWEALQGLAVAIDAAASRLHRRDECGNPVITGKTGHVYADGRFSKGGFLLYVQTRSARAWGFAKKRLAFCRVTQDGDTEGCLALDRMPDSAEAAAIRDVLRIRRRQNLSEETLAARRAQFSSVRGFRALRSRERVPGHGTEGPGRGEGEIGPSAAVTRFSTGAGLPSGVTGTAGA